MNLGLIGPPGCGKSTQAKLLAEKYKLHHLDLGKLVRQKAFDQSKQGELIDHLANIKGKLLPDGIAIQLLLQEIDVYGYDNLLIDGFPRTINQYHALYDYLTTKHAKMSALFYININDDLAIQRVIARGRGDDNKETILERVVEYHQTSKPLLEELLKDHLLIEINGQNSQQQVFAEITSHTDRFTRLSFRPEDPSTYRTFYVVAQSESCYNPDNLFIGRSDPDLTEQGHMEADTSAEILKNESIDLAIHTSLKRSKQTLDHILKYHPNTQIELWDQFIERDYGELTGLNKNEYATNHPDLYPIYHRSYNIPPPGGESIEQIEARIMPALKNLVSLIESKKINILLIAHSNSIRPIRRYFEDLTIEAMMTLEHSRHQIFTYKIKV